jgi:PIN domain nuclease of toxin-antitoxin system
MSLLLDTHIVVWWLMEPDLLSREHRTRLDRAEKRSETAYLSAVSLREIVIAARRGRLSLPSGGRDFVQHLQRHPSFQILPVTSEIALESAQLPDSFPKDPFDQIIAATARCHGLTLVTADEHIRKARVVATL